jgi:glycosyltransferase involved in cell wall biosynthesis
VPLLATELKTEEATLAEVWFWQMIISPHMAHLAVQLARRGFCVTYVAEQAMSDERTAQGWAVPSLPGVTLRWAPTDRVTSELVRSAPADAVHICQGVRANGRIRSAQRELTSLRRQQWIVMETVDDTRWSGWLKRLAYSAHFRLKRHSLRGVLTNGHTTADWVVARGMPATRVFPFAYFLPRKEEQRTMNQNDGPFRFCFAGQLITRKRVDWLIQALQGLHTGRAEFELWIVGVGPEAPVLRAMVAGEFGKRVRWLGVLPHAEVPAVMAQTDCLVLPSLHDGWGAVASEALILGTPVVCSDTCGVAGVVRASGHGGVFPSGSREALAAMLVEQLAKGRTSAVTRSELASWATCLSAPSGAAYLEEILLNAGIAAPLAPWLKKAQPCAA